MNHYFVRITIIMLSVASLYPAAAETKRKRANVPAHPVALPVYTGAGPGPAITSLAVPQAASIAQAREQLKQLSPQEQALVTFKNNHANLVQNIRDAAQKFVDALRKDPATGSRRQISYDKDLDALKQHLREQFQDQLLKTDLAAHLIDPFIAQQAELALAVYKAPVTTNIEELIKRLPEEDITQEFIQPLSLLTPAEIISIFGYIKISHSIIPYAENQQDFSVVLERINSIDPLYEIYMRDKNSTHYTKSNFTIVSVHLPVISDYGNVIATFPNQHSIRLFRRDKNNWIQMGDLLDFSPNTVGYDFSLNAHGSLLTVASIGEDQTTQNVIIYRYTEGQWIAEHTINIPDVEILSSLHISSDNNAEILLIALHEETRVYSKKEGNWEQDIILPPGIINKNGSSVIIYEPESDTSYSYQRQGTTWTRLSSTFYIREVSNNGLVALLYDVDTNQGIIAIPYEEFWQPKFRLQRNDNGMNFDGTIIFNISYNTINIYSNAEHHDPLLIDTIHASSVQNHFAKISNDGLAIIVGGDWRGSLYTLPFTVQKLSLQQQMFLRDLYKASQQGIVVLTPEQEQQFKDLPLSRKLKKIAQQRLRLTTTAHYNKLIEKREKRKEKRKHREQEKTKLKILQEIRDSWAGV